MRREVRFSTVLQEIDRDRQAWEVAINAYAAVGIAFKFEDETLLSVMS